MMITPRRPPLLQPARALARLPRRTLVAAVFCALAALMFVVGSAVAAPTNSGPPTVAGQFVDGGTLSADPGTWTAGTDVSYAYQWQTCPAYPAFATGNGAAGYWRLDDQPNPNGAPATAVDSSGHGLSGTY